MTKYFIYAEGYYEDDSTKIYQCDMTMTMKYFSLEDIREKLINTAHENGFMISGVKIKSVCEIKESKGLL